MFRVTYMLLLMRGNVFSSTELPRPHSARPEQRPSTKDASDWQTGPTHLYSFSSSAYFSLYSIRDELMMLFSLSCLPSPPVAASLRPSSNPPRPDSDGWRLLAGSCGAGGPAARARLGRLECHGDRDCHLATLFRGKVTMRAKLLLHIGT